MKLILLRHGESLWNLENRFTGWTDVSLTSTGKDEASFASDQIINNKIKINTIYTSQLKRAVETTEIVSKNINFPFNTVKFDWRLNERHYGALQGMNKSETAEKYGEKQVLQWRRSYDISPPPLDYNDTRHPRFNPKFKNIKEKLPEGESLKDVICRLTPFWQKYKSLIFRNYNHNHLIIAHSNSLRAIIKTLENLSNEKIMKVNIPTGVPLVYTFDQKYKLRTKKYLIDQNTLHEKQKLIENQGKKNDI